MTPYALLRPTARAIRWAPILAAMAVGTAVVGVPSALTVALGEDDVVNLLRIGAVCGATGLAFAFDDPALRTTEVVPVWPLVQGITRVALTVPAMAAWWTATLWLAVVGAEGDVGADIPRAGLTLEAAVLAVSALAVAAALLPVAAHGNAGTLAAPALLLFVVVLVLLRPPLRMLVAANDPAWAAVRRRWLVLLAIAVFGLLWASSRRSTLPAWRRALRKARRRPSSWRGRIRA